MKRKRERRGRQAWGGLKLQNKKGRKLKTEKEGRKKRKRQPENGDGTEDKTIEEKTPEKRKRERRKTARRGDKIKEP